MITLIKKDLRLFLVSSTAYIFIIGFLLACSVFLFIIPGNINIFDNGYAGLEGFFLLAPWIFLILIPALCMKLFAEEQTGISELLLSRPVTFLQIVLAKYLATFIIVLLALLPALVYIFTVYQLGNPTGNIDMGTVGGSFFGLFLLAGTYMAISIFCAALTSRQITAFVLSAATCFLFFLGFEYIGKLNIFSYIHNQLIAFSINEHYLSLSRGVIDTRDVVYFLSVIISFIVFTTGVLKFKRAQ